MGQSLDRTNQQDPLTARAIAAAIEVHRQLGSGLLESAYLACMCHELNSAGIQFRKEVPVPIDYKGLKLDCGYRMDLVASDEVVVELKSVNKLLPLHKAQLITYLKLTGLKRGCLSISMCLFSLMAFVVFQIDRILPL